MDPEMNPWFFPPEYLDPAMAGGLPPTTSGNLPDQPMGTSPPGGPARYGGVTPPGFVSNPLTHVGQGINAVSNLIPTAPARYGMRTPAPQAPGNNIPQLTPTGTPPAPAVPPPVLGPQTRGMIGMGGSMGGTGGSMGSPFAANFPSPQTGGPTPGIPEMIAGAAGNAGIRPADFLKDPSKLAAMFVCSARCGATRNGGTRP